jgi:small multidrug resistance pump
VFTYLLLAGAIVSEVSATISLRLSQGFSKLVPSIVVCIGYPVAFAFLAFVLKRGLPVAVAYAVWSAVGVTAVAIISVLWLGDHLSKLQIGGLAFIVIGVVALEAGVPKGA